MFGLAVECDLDLPIASIPKAPAELRVVHAPDLGRHPMWHGPPLLDTMFNAHGGPVRYQLFSRGFQSGLRIGSVGDFVFDDDLIRYRPAPEAWPGAVARYLMTFVFCHWLERRGKPVLHGAAVEMDDSAVILLAGGGTGKSTLAVAFADAGYRVLSDDFAALVDTESGIHALPSYPMVGLWPEGAWATSVLNLDSSDRLHPDVNKRLAHLAPHAFCPSARPVAAVFSLLRSNEGPAIGEARVVALHGAEAVVECVRQSIAPKTAAAAGLDADRIDIFSKLVNQAPIGRLCYRSTRQEVDSLREIITAQVRGYLARRTPSGPLRAPGVRL